MPCAETKLGRSTIEDVLAQVRKLMVRICQEDQGYGSITVIINPDKVDVKQDSNLRFGGKPN